jgi:competence protein ComEC
MVVFALGFVVGAWWLQQQEHLIHSHHLLLVWLFGLLVAFGVSRYCRRVSSRFSYHVVVKLFGLSALAVMAGLTWANTLAHVRLSEALPAVWEQRDIRIVGVVANLPERTERGERFLLDVEQVLTPAARVPSTIALSYYTEQPTQAAMPHSDYFSAKNSVKSLPMQFHAGERWQLTVRLKRPHTTYNPHGYDYEAWLLSEGVRATGTVRSRDGLAKQTDLVWQPRYLIEYLREQIGERIQRVLGDASYAGVIRALVIGEDSQITAEDWNVYLRTGTNHLMSISGLHITMLSGLVFVLVYWGWRKFPRLVLRYPARKVASLLGLLTALIYAALAGFSVPTQRTLYMLMTMSVLLLSGRQFALSKLLAVAVIVVVVIDPWAVIAPGFWLSFGAVAVMAYAMGARLAPSHWLWSTIKVQWAVTIGLVPGLLLMFGQASLASPLANAIAIPVISFIVVPLSLLGSLLPIDTLLQVAHGALALCMQGLHWVSSWPLAVWQQASPAPWAVVLGLLGVVWMLMPRGIPLRWMGALCLTPMLFPRLEQLQTGELKLAVLDVGQGLSVVVQTAHHALLYDAGPRYSVTSDAGQRIVVPYLRGQGVTQLNGVVISHDDNDHAGGMPSVLAHVPVEWLASSLQAQAALFTQPQWQAVIPAERMWCYAGQAWHWDDVQFEVLWPSLASYEDADLKDNDRSCVIKITSPYGTVLLTGDIEKRTELALLNAEADLQSDIMIAPHHGSNSSSTLGFLEVVAANHVVMTNGYRNRFGHPKPKVEARYRAKQAKVYRSDYDGAVLFRLSHDQGIAVNRWRKSHRRYWHDDYSQINHD